MASTLPISGKGSTASELPLSPAAAREYFGDVARFLQKIESVDAVKPLARPGCFLVTHHPMGALDYHVVLVTCLQTEWHEGGMRLAPLDFDLEKVACPHDKVKGFIESELVLAPAGGDRTAVSFEFKASVELPLVGPLRFLPRPLVQVTADGIMKLEANRVVQNLFKAVLADFGPEGLKEPAGARQAAS